MWSTFKDAVLFLLAIYAASLSTWNLVQATKKEKRSILVTAGSAIPTYPNGEMGRTWAHIEATNTGQRPVTVATLAFELDTGGRLFTIRRDGVLPNMPDTPLPVTLADGQTAHLYQSYEDIGKALLQHGRTKPSRLTPICVDTAGGAHRGESWTVDPNEFCRM